MKNNKLYNIYFFQNNKKLTIKIVLNGTLILGYRLGGACKCNLALQALKSSLKISPS